MERILRVPEVHVFAYDRYSDQQAEVLNELICFLQALVKKDMEYLRRHVDPGAEYETPAGRKQKYSWDFEELQNGRNQYDFVTIQAPMIFPGDDQAFVSVLALMKGLQGGKRGIHPRQLNLKFRKENGNWIIT